MRVKFEKGKQREFLKKVMEKTLSPSIRGLKQFGVEVNYSTLKNYYSEDRTLSLPLFQNLCLISKIDEKDIKHEILQETWADPLVEKSLREGNNSLSL